MNNFLHRVLREWGFIMFGLGFVESYFFYSAQHWGNLAYAVVGTLLAKWLVCRMHDRVQGLRPADNRRPPATGNPWGDTNKNGPAPEVRAVVLNDDNRDEIIGMIRRAVSYRIDEPAPQLATTGLVSCQHGAAER